MCVVQDEVNGQREWVDPYLLQLIFGVQAGGHQKATLCFTLSRRGLHLLPPDCAHTHGTWRGFRALFKTLLSLLTWDCGAYELVNPLSAQS